jgi:hypothetical protein
MTLPSSHWAGITNAWGWSSAFDGSARHPRWPGRILLAHRSNSPIYPTLVPKLASPDLPSLIPRQHREDLVAARQFVACQVQPQMGVQPLEGRGASVLAGSINACTRRPRSSSLSPITAASRTPGCWVRIASTSAGTTLAPPGGGEATADGAGLGLRIRIGTLRDPPSQPATKLAFEWLILTATRSGETRGARFDEIDTKAALWTIPAAHEGSP